MSNPLQNMSEAEMRWQERRMARWNAEEKLISPARGELYAKQVEDVWPRLSKDKMPPSALKTIVEQEYERYQMYLQYKAIDATDDGLGMYEEDSYNSSGGYGPYSNALIKKRVFQKWVANNNSDSRIRGDEWFDGLKNELEPYYRGFGQFKITAKTLAVAISALPSKSSWGSPILQPKRAQLSLKAIVEMDLQIPDSWKTWWSVVVDLAKSQPAAAKNRKAGYAYQKQISALIKSIRDKLDTLMDGERPDFKFRTYDEMGQLHSYDIVNGHVVGKIKDVVRYPANNEWLTVEEWTIFWYCVIWENEWPKLIEMAAQQFQAEGARGDPGLRVQSKAAITLKVAQSLPQDEKQWKAEAYKMLEQSYNTMFTESLLQSQLDDPDDVGFQDYKLPVFDIKLRLYFIVPAIFNLATVTYVNWYVERAKKLDTYGVWTDSVNNMNIIKRWIAVIQANDPTHRCAGADYDYSHFDQNTAVEDQVRIMNDVHMPLLETYNLDKDDITTVSYVNAMRKLHAAYIPNQFLIYPASMVEQGSDVPIATRLNSTLSSGMAETQHIGSSYSRGDAVVIITRLKQMLSTSDHRLAGKALQLLNDKIWFVQTLGDDIIVLLPQIVLDILFNDDYEEFMSWSSQIFAERGGVVNATKQVLTPTGVKMLQQVYALDGSRCGGMPMLRATLKYNAEERFKKAVEDVQASVTCADAISVVSQFMNVFNTLKDPLLSKKATIIKNTTLQDYFKNNPATCNIWAASDSTELKNATGASGEAAYFFLLDMATGIDPQSLIAELGAEFHDPQNLSEILLSSNINKRTGGRSLSESPNLKQLISVFKDAAKLAIAKGWVAKMTLAEAMSVIVQADLDRNRAGSTPKRPTDSNLQV
jgi:hypothetical protein